MAKNLAVNLENADGIGENAVAAVVEDGGRKLLVLVVDMGKEIGPSSSGKMMGIASTGGFSRANGVSINLYVGRKL